MILPLEEEQFLLKRNPEAKAWARMPSHFTHTPRRQAMACVMQRSLLRGNSGEADKSALGGIQLVRCGCAIMSHSFNSLMEVLREWPHVFVFSRSVSGVHRCHHHQVHFP